MTPFTNFPMTPSNEPLVKITGCQDYDLLALPEGEKPAEFKVAKQGQ